MEKFKKYFKCCTFYIMISELLCKKQNLQLLALGRLLSNQQYCLNSNNINDYEFKVYSQRGEDGIIQFLIKNLKITNQTFIEFGVENYLESNTRFLLMNNNWSGYVIDGSNDYIRSLQKRPWYWMFDLQSKCAFIDKDNINSLMDGSGFTDLGILSIDLDGNDFWIFDSLDLSRLRPSIIIAEYNALFGCDRFITVPYNKFYNRTRAHYTNLYFGASLPAINHVADKKGYSLVCCCEAGTNAFFVRNDLLNNKITKQFVSSAFIQEKSRQGRDKDYKLSLNNLDERLKLIRGLEVINIKTMLPELI